MTDDDGTQDAASGMPFVAPCRPLAPGAPLEWIRRGWSDLLAAPRQSLAYGTVIVLLSWALAWVTIRFGGYWELLALLTGFIFVAPVLAVGTYAISAQLERGQRPSLRRCLFEKKRCFANLMVFALIVLVVYLVWWRAASAIHVFFPDDVADSGWSDYAVFFGIGSAVGAFFALVVFAASAFALPMLVDRRVDTVTTVVTSVNAVLRNKPAMAVWAAMIVIAVSPGFSLLFLGRESGAPLAAVMVLLGVTMPLIGHATWHAYRQTVIADDWPAADAPAD